MEFHFERIDGLKRLPKYRLPLILTLLAAVLLAGCITLLALWCQPNALRSVLIIFKAQPLLIVLNALPVGLILLALTCLFRNIFFGAAVTNLLVCGFSIANRVKIEVRDEPVFPRDLALLKEVGAIVSDYDISYPWGSVAIVAIASLALLVIGLFVKCRPLSPAARKARKTKGAFAVLEAPNRLRSWLLRLAGCTASLGVLAALIMTVYASNDLYNSFKVSNSYYVPSVFNELGFPYCFCHQFTTYPVDKPDGFSKGQAELWEQEAAPQKGEKQPVNVIMVMNEAFSDITDYETFAYDESSDPLPNLHAMQQDPHAVTGHIVVPNFAAGTANTEFDVMTGIQTNALAATTTSAMRVVNRDLDSLFRVYGRNGYHTSYFHPGDNWFYNRENVLAWMGADETRFTNRMETLEYKGRWVTDACLVSMIQDEFEEAVADGNTLFHYMTTIQNHMSYTPDKYGDGYFYPEVPLDISVSGHVETLLKVYTEGARDADAMLGELKEYFSDRSEPVVLVFFGDHLPYLGDNQVGYAELGMSEDPYWSDLGSFETPFVIWANDTAFEMLDWSAAAELPETISASFLGAAVLELTGHSSDSSWFSFLNDLRREIPVVQKNTAVLNDGSIVNPYLLDDETPNGIQKWRQWSYYKLKYQVFD